MCKFVDHSDVSSLEFYSGHKKVEKTEGVIHFYKHQSVGLLLRSMNVNVSSFDDKL